MVIEISYRAFLDKNNFQSISYLLKLCSFNHRYSFFVELSLVRDTEIFKSLDSDSRDTIENYFSSYVEGSLKPDLEIDPTNQNKMGIEEGIRYLSPPFILLLENSLNDSYFINSLIKNFKKHAKKIQHSINFGWFEYGNAGGCNNIPNFIENKALSFQGLPKDKYSYLRIFVIMDSDKTFPEDSVTNKNKVFDFLNSKNISYHVLEKREIENYLPNIVFQELEKEDIFINAYQKLTSLQKDYFDIENGFKDVNFKSLDPNIQDLYSDLSQEDYMIFRKRKIDISVILRKYPIIMDKEGNNDYKQLLPRLFNLDVVKGADLQNRCNHQVDPNELVSILTEISQRL
ncbi:hypothetical protein [Sediminibacterium sp.]|uniref:hypothetical protein n=1 Tax=Sediminibacterium sp. TaxID=1917865 RepID=UPI003F6F53F6